MSGAVCNGTLTSGISTKPKFEALPYLYFYYNYCSFSKHQLSQIKASNLFLLLLLLPCVCLSACLVAQPEKNQASLILWAKCMPDIMKRPSFSFPNNTLVEFLEMIVIKLMAFSFYLLLASFFLFPFKLMPIFLF